MENLEEQPDQASEDTTELQDENKPEKKEKSTLTCTTVHRIAWNNEEATFENESIKVTVNVKDPALHGKFTVGKKYNKIL